MDTKRALMKGAEFRSLITKLKPCIIGNTGYKNATFSMVELSFRDNRVTGYACNGSEFIKSSEDCTAEDSFIAYIRVPRFLPNKNTDVSIEAGFEGEKLVNTTVSFDEVTFQYPAPESSKDLHLFEDDLVHMCTEESFDVYLNAALLKNVIAPIQQKRWCPTVLKVTIGAPMKPVYLAYENTKAYVLPIRHREKESDHKKIEAEKRADL